MKRALDFPPTRMDLANISRSIGQHRNALGNMRKRFPDTFPDKGDDGLYDVAEVLRFREKQVQCRYDGFRENARRWRQ